MGIDTDIIGCPGVHEYFYSGTHKTGLGMNRRTYLSAIASGTALIAGCSSSSSDPNREATDPDPSVSEAGLAPNPIDLPEREIDKSRFETYTASNDAGTSVQGVPLDVAYYWYNTRKARFVDARTTSQFEEHHIEGAVLSQAPSGGSSDPVSDWGKTERIVTYCTCPHHLSGIRAGNLIENGFSGAYALWPGFEPWAEKGYQTAGSVKNKTEFVDDYSNVKDDDE